MRLARRRGCLTWLDLVSTNETSRTPALFRRLAAWAIPALAATGFIVDLLTPQGIDDWVWYFFSLVLTLFISRRGSLPFMLAWGFSMLTLAG